MNASHEREVDRLEALLADPKSDTEELDLLYLRLIASQLAPIAQAGYQREGRGAVVIGFYGIDVRQPNNEGLPAYYLAHSRAYLLSVDGQQ